MTEEKQKRGYLSQILVAVVVALLAGGTAPWWWNELKGVSSITPDKVEAPPQEAPGDTLRKALEDYEAVQALYRQSKITTGTCIDLRRIIEQIRVYTGNQRLIPESFRYTIQYPSQKPLPTISDMVADRIFRIKDVKPECF